ncbi:3-oxo-5-alpha-steroid 4-dehydrogenase family protein-like protein [Eremomyces bilateralis CBS 781.70]|uniref:3-oxo-5-alpha-steroid 4-dehydrogenase family protein-like protein n=1 Tax=Eremomyces bilateralis CBS 781.70 TaxID=1392243 RepID=A0A6G1FZV6_9PEZI|nr:3-oxo-5-alpha-steroid 4-dehydrogenase family protein-like protein [Eremomyces bilateralis CBS 781.70]KAF1811211.1 3-oxo-5-alpha-steroid 4-dehydrogenase family protein-like protein [Eremomyces bilateralis CBS 781.70]
MSEDREITVLTRPRGKPIPRLPDSVPLPISSPTAALYTSLAKSTGHTPHRLRLTKGSDGSPLPNSSTTTLASTGLRDRSVVHVKDLGPQIAWRTVFIVEYLGPLLIHPLLYSLRLSPASPFAPAGVRASELQTASLALVCLHFLKREWETVAVHRFSAATMPARNIVKNSGHYWLLSGLLVAFFTYSPSVSNPISAVAAPGASVWDPLPLAGIALFAVGEGLNLVTHLKLSNLRPAGTTTRGIPRGFPLFETVTCPNYTFELLAWLGMALVNRSWTTVVFAVVAGATMGLWAQKKERRYRKEFKEYKRKRSVMIPFVF